MGLERFYGTWNGGRKVGGFRQNMREIRLFMQLKHRARTVNAILALSA